MRILNIKILLCFVLVTSDVFSYDPKNFDLKEAILESQKKGYRNFAVFYFGFRSMKDGYCIPERVLKETDDLNRSFGIDTIPGFVGFDLDTEYKKEIELFDIEGDMRKMPISKDMPFSMSKDTALSISKDMAISKAKRKCLKNIFIRKGLDALYFAQYVEGLVDLTRIEIDKEGKFEKGELISRVYNIESNKRKNLYTNLIVKLEHEGKVITVESSVAKAIEHLNYERRKLLEVSNLENLIYLKSMLINDSTLIGLNGLEKLSGFERLTIDASTLLKGDLFKNLKLAKHLILYRDTVPEDLVIEKVDSKEIKLILNKIKGNIVIKSCNIRKVFLNGNSAYKVIFVDSKIGTVELLDNLFRSYEIESINSTVDTFKKSEALDPVQNPQQKIRNPNTKL